MVKSVPPASDSASVTAARTGRSTKTVPLAVTTITIPTGTDNRVEWPALGPTRNLGKLPDAMTCRSTAPRLIEPSVTAGCAPETCAANIRFNVGLRRAISLTSAIRLDVRRGRRIGSGPGRSSQRFDHFL